MTGDDGQPFTLEIRGLDKLIKALKTTPPTVKIGVLGNNSRHPTHGEKSAPTNSLLAAVHEFGAPARNIPQRSFLRIPLSENLNKEIESSGLLDKDTLNAVIQNGSIVPWMKQVAVCAEAVVDDAFENQGPGWAPWKSPYYHNEGGLILTDSGQLRQSITTEVSE